MSRIAVLLAILAVAACGPTRNGNNGGGDGGQDELCTPGDTRDCYDGVSGTKDIGPCHGGTQTCGDQGLWQACQDEVVPQAENCTDGIDNNCNGKVDEDEDADGDGYFSCRDHDCCDSTECSNPKEVNPGAFDVAGDGVDNDCDGQIDNTQLLCDQGLTSNSADPMDYAKAIDICQTATESDPMKKWGVIDAKWTFADGTGTPNVVAHAIRAKYGQGVLPKGGVSLIEISTGNAAAKGDQNPAYEDLESGGGHGGSSGFPADFLQANGGDLPNAPGCPGPDGATANDPVMLTLRVRVPTNAHSFSINSNFFSSEFPEYTCSPFNDFFVILLDSTYTGDPANPTDKNLAFYASGSNKFPVGVNLASGDTGLFTECVNGPTGCFGTPGNISTCKEVAQLAGTGLEVPDDAACGAGETEGGGTGWLTTSGNVVPGEIITLRIALWNTSDDALQSLAVIDGFTWSADSSDPGTVIE